MSLHRVPRAPHINGAFHSQRSTPAPSLGSGSLEAVRAPVLLVTAAGEAGGWEGLDGDTPLLAGTPAQPGGGWAAHGCSRWKPLARNVCDVVWSSVNKSHELSSTL